MASEEKGSAFLNFVFALGRTMERPVTWWRETVVTPNQQQYYWYHRKYPRVPTVDQCYTDDPVCIFEADEQFKRDKAVDGRILTILRNRVEFCVRYHGGQDEKSEKECGPLWEKYEEAAGNWFCKYGDLGFTATSKDAYMKQKHRLIWERRHGKVGSGMTANNE